jgi:predicted ArsR family transcriptional regulator
MLDKTAGAQILATIKTRGPQSIAAVAARLGVTHEAVRVQLNALAAEGFLHAAKQPSAKAGRPVQLWSLTAAGHKKFPDGHAELAVALIEAIRSAGGDNLLETVIAACQPKIQAAYEEALAPLRTLRARVKRLAELREREGYMASWTATEDGFLLVEAHCPIHEAASACLGFCAAELDLFRAVLGCAVERTDHIQVGARHCAYKITG